MEDHMQLCGTNNVKCSICGLIMDPLELSDHAIAHNIDQIEIQRQNLVNVADNAD